MVVGVGYVIMKKRILLLVAAVLCISLCACGGTETTNSNNSTEEKQENGFTPVQDTEIDTEINKMFSENEEEIDTENLEKYYDTEQFVGKPTLENVYMAYEHDSDTVLLRRKVSVGIDIEFSKEYFVEKPSSLEGASGQKSVKCIIVDNNTPDDYEDDQIAYIFLE